MACQDPGFDLRQSGGNEGLGKETVFQLAKHQPATVFFTARTQEKADKAIADIKQKAAGSTLAPIEFIRLDLSSFDSIKQAASTVRSRTDRLDVLIANAGVLGVTGLTQEGYEWAFGVNHVGTSLFVRLLLPLLQETAAWPDAQKGATRVVFLSSLAEKHSPVPYTFDRIRTELKDLATFTVYGQSKLANAHYAAQLAKRYPEATSGVKFVSVHPGGVESKLGEDLLPLPGFLKKPIKKAIYVIMRVVPTEQGVWNSLWAATATKESSKLGKPKEGVLYWPVALAGQHSKNFENQEMAESLWEWTEKELGPHLGEDKAIAAA